MDEQDRGSKRYQDKTVVITGASDGIGAELARQTRRRGFNAHGQPAGVSGLAKDQAMPVDECARQILAAMARRRRERS